jgi:hypothetical protein
MVVDSVRRGPYKQPIPIQVSERGQYWRSRRNARLNDVCGGWEQQLGPHQWHGRCVAPPAHTRGLGSVNPRSAPLRAAARHGDNRRVLPGQPVARSTWVRFRLIPPLIYGE